MERTPLLAPASHHHTSTFTQSTLNTLNLLCGLGILSLPFAFSQSGWLCGIIMIVGFSFAAARSAQRMMACLERMQEMEISSKIVTFGDVTEHLFGPIGRHALTLLFMLELLAASVALILVFCDSVLALYPNLQSHTWMIKVLIVLGLAPMCWFRSLGFLSYLSGIGIFSIFNLILIVVFDGIMTPEGLGSLWKGPTTHMWPESLNGFLLAIGLIFVGLDGHAVFPSIYRDMRDPRQFGAMINLSYSLLIVIYICMALCGYFMFGKDTLPEISQNLALVPTFPILATQWTLWLILINPMTKYALVLSPVNAHLESLFNIRDSAWRFVSRSCLCGLTLMASLLIPRFHQLMGLLGSGMSFMIAIIIPMGCYGLLMKKRRIECLIVVMMGACLCMGGVWGAWQAS